MINVRRVDIHGVPFIGFRGTFSSKKGLPRLEEDLIAVNLMKSKGVYAKVFTDDGRVARVRLNDFKHMSLLPSLHPDSFTQSFVSGSILKKAERLLENYPIILARAQKMQEAPINWGGLPFDFNFCDAMVVATADYPNGKWEFGERGALYPFEQMNIHPSAVVLHYGQGIFEGMKVFYSKQGRLVAFRPQDNAARMQRGAERLCMNPIPTDFLIEAVKATVIGNKRLLPPYGVGASMYVRPFEFGSGPKLGVKPAAEDTLCIFASPVGPYFKGGLTPITLLVESNSRRSAHGIVGNIKAGGNYAPSMLVAKEAKKQHPEVSEVIYLSSDGQNKIEEVGAANFFAIEEESDGRIALITPRLTGTILPGITRDSVIKLAKAFGYSVMEKDIAIETVMRGETIVGAFCTGTAAVISPIGKIIMENGSEAKEVSFNGGTVHPVAEKLYHALTALQVEDWDNEALKDLPKEFIDEVKKEWVYVLEE